MMDLRDAISFLEKNQPFLSDETLELEVSTFKDVLVYFQGNPNPACIPLLLNCFGTGSGFGLYQTIEDLLSLYDDGLVVLHLKNALKSEHEGVRYWCSQISSNYVYPSLIESLINVFKGGDLDTKCAALTSLSNYKTEHVKSLAKEILKSENDELLQEIATDILES